MWYYPALRIFFATLGVAVVAVAIWLTIRIINRRETWAKWMAVWLVAVLIAYPLSMGPACWIARRWDNPYFNTACDAAYYPILLILANGGNSPIRRAVAWYMDFGAPEEPEDPEE